MFGHERQGSAFSSGEVDEDGYVVHRAACNERTPLQRRNTTGPRDTWAAVRSSVRRSSTRRSMLSMTSEAAGQRGFFLPSGGIGASVFNLCSATLGAGVLALPKCGEYSGWLMSSVYVMLSGTASCYAIVVLVMVANRTGLMSYEEMSLKILGSRKWVWLSVLLIALLCFGTAVGYIIAIGDVLDPFRLIKGSPDWLTGEKGRIYTQVAWWLIFYLPASLPKHVNALRLGSMIGVFSVGFLLLMMSIHLGENVDKPKVSLVKKDVASLFSLPVIMFGYGCQVNTFEIYKEMYKPSAKRMSLVAVIALFTCSASYIAASIIGYSDFGSSVDNNILNNFNPTTNYMATVAFVGISVTITMAFPLCVFPTRDALQFLIWPPTEEQIQVEVDDAAAALLAKSVPATNYSGSGLDRAESGTRSKSEERKESDKKDSDDDDDDDEGGVSYGDDTPPGYTDNKRQLLVITICVLILLSGLFIPNITTAFGVIGGLCIGPIGYSIPALFALKSGHWTVNAVGRGHVIAVYLLFAYGVICATVGTGISIYSIVMQAEHH